MKYLKSFGGLIKESNRFLHFKEVLDTIEDLSLDFTDDGGETIFGNMPSVDIMYANFDENLDDIFIKMASLGKKSVYVKFDIQNIKKSLVKFNQLSEESLELLIDTINSVYNYLLGEGMVVKNFWTKELVARKRSDYGKNEFFSYKTIDELINSIDNTPRLKEFYSSKSDEIKKDLMVLNKKTKDPVTKIKINEVVSLIKPLDKNVKVTDNDVVNLLQYCDLLTELETVNA